MSMFYAILPPPPVEWWSIATGHPKKILQGQEYCAHCWNASWFRKPAGSEHWLGKWEIWVLLLGLTLCVTLGKSLTLSWHCLLLAHHVDPDHELHWGSISCFIAVQGSEPWSFCTYRVSPFTPLCIFKDVESFEEQLCSRTVVQMDHFFVVNIWMSGNSGGTFHMNIHLHGKLQNRKNNLYPQYCIWIIQYTLSDFFPSPPRKYLYIQVSVYHHQAGFPIPVLCF